MKTVLNIKDEYAKSLEFSNWGGFLLFADKSELNMALNVVAQEYSKEVIKSKLDIYENTLLDKIKSMQKTADNFFGIDSDFSKGNKTALDNFKVHIKELKPTE